MKLYVDGGVVGGNPGDFVYWSVGWEIAGETTVVINRAESHEHTTNNQAEYLAIIAGLEYALENWMCIDRRLVIRSDSQVVVRQITGQYTAKKKFHELRGEAWELIANLDAREIEVQIEWVSRKENVKRLGH